MSPAYHNILAWKCNFRGHVDYRVCVFKDTRAYLGHFEAAVAQSKCQRPFKMLAF